MAKKKTIKQQPPFSEEDLAYIEFKMNPTSRAIMNAEPIPYVDYNYNVDIKCKNQKQKQYLNLLKDESKQIVAALGAPGTGKSWISLAYGLNCLKHGLIKRIVAFVPTTPAGARALDIGFLPGDIGQKIQPYVEADCETMRSILEDSGNPQAAKIVDGLRRNKVIEHRLLNYSRGATINDALILLNESQNFSYDEFMLLFGRMGKNSRVILSGDIAQLDRRDIVNNGKKESVLEIVERLSDLEEFGQVIFDKEDIVRNPLIAKILERLESLRENKLK